MNKISFVKLGAVLGLALYFSSAWSAPLRVAATLPDLAALTQEVGGEAVEVVRLTTPAQDPHRVIARPSLIAKVAHADVVVAVGMELESGWLPVLLRQARNDRLTPQGGLIDASKAPGLTILGKPAGSVTRDEGDIHPDGNPHYTLDPRAMLPLARHIVAQLKEQPGADTATLDAGLARFETRWGAFLAGWLKRAALLQGARLVLDHESWPYLLDAVGAIEAGVLEPKPGIPPTTRHLAELGTMLSRQPARAIVIADWRSPDAAQWLSDHTGLPVVKLPTGSGEEGLEAHFDAILNRLLQAAAR
ncbi:MAG: zinc ABC transporter substrate-binding protein [Alphaproteobacteria bacterium CG_4_10_14_0_2_um_filter_63_37]|nr:MAG: hypothetical protein AUJ55_01825 [Proteobacteria bacterium CG1_02_64_396]PJA24933.1 MAG: zinc ABC transporter substrate-binding protein [Alphaproteobacteria bacterium CG_4_10_14_0_2_um_filter_63_37]